MIQELAENKLNLKKSLQGSNNFKNRADNLFSTSKKKRGIVNEKMMTNDSLSFFDEDIKLCALRWIRKD